MGFRFRKSINLGGGFRINLSKSGVGYSWGTKGYRITKKASGGTRTTASIPGTGISYVSDTKKSRSKKSNNGSSAHSRNIVPSQINDNNHYDAVAIKNSNAANMVSAGLEELLAAANASLKSYSLALVCFFTTLVIGCAFPPLWILSLISLIYALRVKKNGVINLEYTFEDNQAELVKERMKPLQNIAKSKKVWWITQSSKVIDKKYAAGANNTLDRKNCKASGTVPFPFKTNSIAVSFRLKKETLVFLPDKLFVIQGMKIGALNYEDVRTSVAGQRFIEREAVPKDAKVIDYTWQYVNKTGGPDKRFQNNKKIPVCLYGKMEVSGSGVNTVILFSNPNIER